MELPKYDNASKKGEDGLTIVKTIVQTELKWVFRKNHQEEDFGIDAYFDIITEVGQVTGKSIAVQIKTGASYFKEKNELGWTYRGELKHLNYYLNHDIPVVIIIVDDNDKVAYWCLCDSTKTEKAGDNWKITIPFSQKLNASSKTELQKFISPVTDYVSQLEHFWSVNKMLLGHQKLLLIVGKDDILKNNFSDLISAFTRLEANAELILHNRGKVDVSIHGYDNDPRELFEIPEVMTWVQAVFKKIDSWTYFLSMDATGQFMKVLFIAHAKFQKISPNQLEYDTKHSSEFISALFNGLNKFCDKHSISDEVNIEQCDRVMNYLTEGQFVTEHGKL
jgi:hypothetical protein